MDGQLKAETLRQYLSKFPEAEVLMLDHITIEYPDKTKKYYDFMKKLLKVKQIIQPITECKCHNVDMIIGENASHSIDNELIDSI